MTTMILRISFFITTPLRGLELLFGLACLSLVACSDSGDQKGDDIPPVGDRAYPIVDTNQIICYDTAEAVACGSTFSGQDAAYEGQAPTDAPPSRESMFM